LEVSVEVYKAEYEEEREEKEFEKVAEVGWASLSRSGKSLTIKVLDEIFFVPLRQLLKVLDGDESRVAVKQWRE
jgi:adenylylsulfate kinase-like enzyme